MAARLSVRWRVVVAAFPFVFLPHELEEALFATHADEMVRRLDERLRQRLGDRTPDLAGLYQRRLGLTRDEALGAAAMAAALGAATAWPVALRPRRGPALYLFAAMTGLRLVNGAMHVAQAAAARRYAPGLATGVGIALPYSLLTLRALRRAGLLERGDAARATLTGLALLPTAAAVIRIAARRRRGRPGRERIPGLADEPLSADI